MTEKAKTKFKKTFLRLLKEDDKFAWDIYCALLSNSYKIGNEYFRITELKSY